MNNAVIAGTGSYVPEKIMTNEDLEKIVDTSDEWISSRTGIRQRRISEGENTSKIATKAAIKALEDANMDALDIDLIIVATVTPDAFTPSVSCLVQVDLGAKNASCFDITAGCSGFVYGINVANQFIKTGQAKNVLVIGAEVLSKVVNWEDRNTCVLFGDGAGAAVLKASQKEGIISVHTGSKGDENRYLEIPAIEVNNPFSPKVEGRPSYIKMNGVEIFKFATKIMRKSFKNVLESTDYSLDDIKYIIPHQANYRIIDHVAQKANIDINKFYLNLDKYGNTSSASIGIALDEMNKKGLLNKDDKLILVGFGGGLTWGAVLLKWSK
ncbi:beta-ketoacyl-ACP synthase III [Abyssisolibacter fermentans]|uniref:beta-ketoacyl-ACP synthase III n=1 Tax=Abyssisolibacter fermentans TaxID=1766203 RepID=UPI000829AE97|nr:beta-ketoacyl-ACP synthase III [Abyssisolibacter fermentans]